MPVWKNRLQPNEVVLVASYVASLREELQGTRPRGRSDRPVVRDAGHIRQDLHGRHVNGRGGRRTR